MRRCDAVRRYFQEFSQGSLIRNTLVFSVAQRRNVA